MLRRDETLFHSQLYYLPPEIWLNIFQSQQLSRRNLRNVSLTQRSFRLLAQPLLFRYITFDTLLSWTTDGSYQTPAYLLRFHERLKFLASEPIAPLVRSILTYRFSRPMSSPSPTLVSCYEMHVSLFTSLPRFPNLCVIGGLEIKFTLPMLISLYSVPRLQRINLFMCHTDIDKPLDNTRRSKIVELKYSPRDFWGDTSRWWLSFVPPETTREISVNSPDQSITLLRYISRTVPTRMKALKTLQLLLVPSREALLSFKNAIMKCPSLNKLALEELLPNHLSHWVPFAKSVAQLLETGILPNLQEIKVTTATFAIPFVRTCSLRKLEILPCYIDKDSSESLLREIKQHCPHIAYLTIPLLSFSVDVFIHILNLPSLEYLFMPTKSDLTKKSIDDARIFSLLQTHRYNH